MEPKGVLKRKGVSLTTLTATELKSGLAKARFLNSSEEKTLRMRHGVGVEASELLPKACENNEELADELLLIEMQLFRAARMRQSQTGLAQLRAHAKPSPQKSKIISALRAKK